MTQPGQVPRTSASLAAEPRSTSDPAASPAEPMFTICLSREAGSNALAVATELGKRLDWPVYDKELIDIISRELGVRTNQLEMLDEKPKTWLEKAFVDNLNETRISHETYVTQLVASIRSLSSQGHCIIVGRGASFILPSENTLRVKLVADLHERLTMIRQVRGLNEADALKWIEETTRERHEFVHNHLKKDTDDVHLVDLVINLTQFSVPQVADLIMEALKKKQAFATQRFQTSTKP